MTEPRSIAANLRSAIELLTESSDSPRLDTESLLAHSLEKPRSHLFAWPEKVIDADQQKHFDKLIEQQQQRLDELKRLRTKVFGKPDGKKGADRAAQARYKLRNGAQSTVVNETIGNRSSSGQVSRIFTGRRGQKQETSRGRTSKANRSGGN